MQQIPLNAKVVCTTRIRYQKGILYLRLERFCILNFFRGNFNGEMVIWYYHNISLKNIKSDMLKHLQNTFLWYSNVSDALYRMTLSNEAIQKYLFYLLLTTGSLIKCTRMYINIWCWSVVSSEIDSVQCWSKSRSIFDVFLLLISK